MDWRTMKVNRIDTVKFLRLKDYIKTLDLDNNKDLEDLVIYITENSICKLPSFIAMCPSCGVVL